MEESSTQMEPALIQDAREESGNESEKEQLSEAEPNEVREFAKGIAELDEELFQGGQEKEKQTRRQKRIERQKHAEKRNLHPLDVSLQELQQLQEEDETLEAVRKAADGGNSSAERVFFKEEGLIYRRWTPPGRDEEEMTIKQLVLPQKCRRVVLELAHNIPLAGHMGKNKTTSLFSSFYIVQNI